MNTQTTNAKAVNCEGAGTWLTPSEQVHPPFVPDEFDPGSLVCPRCGLITSVFVG